jgi:hypothetical protein
VYKPHSLQMSSQDRSRIKPPLLRIRYASRPVKNSGSSGTSTFHVQYINSSTVQNHFWEAWRICLGLFLSVGFMCAGIRVMKWKVNHTSDVLVVLPMWLPNSDSMIALRGHHCDDLFFRSASVAHMLTVTTRFCSRCSQRRVIVLAWLWRL